MYEVLRTWRELKADRHAVTMLEYAMMAALIAGVVVGIIPTLSTAISNAFTTVAGNI